VAIGLGALCESVSTGGELVVASVVGVSAVTRVGEVSEAASTGSELVVVASALGVSAVGIVGELCEAASTGGELVVVACAVAGVGDVATERLAG
jgi:DNA transposition AAA+ family ATPase